jgi:hypothetical protein
VTLGFELADGDVLARQVVGAKRRLRKSAPSVVDLASAITDVRIEDTITGTSTLTISLVDPDWRLLDSGFFDTNEDGKLDTIDVRYPEGSRHWWRLKEVDLDGASNQVGLVFIERAAAYLIEKKGPLKVKRGDSTRSEFVGRLVHDVKASKLTFVSKQHHVEQAIAPVEPTEARSGRERSDKTTRRASTPPRAGSRSTGRRRPARSSSRPSGPSTWRRPRVPGSARRWP